MRSFILIGPNSLRLEHIVEHTSEMHGVTYEFTSFGFKRSFFGNKNIKPILTDCDKGSKLEVHEEGRSQQGQTKSH